MQLTFLTGLRITLDRLRLLTVSMACWRNCENTRKSSNESTNDLCLPICSHQLISSKMLHPSGKAARRGDGVVGPHGDANKRRKVDLVCRPKWEETTLCAECPSSAPVSTWRGWDNDGVPCFYCLNCWSKYFDDQEASRCSEATDRRRLEDLSATLEGLDISGTGGSSSSPGKPPPVVRRNTTRAKVTFSLSPIDEDPKPVIDVPWGRSYRDLMADPKKVVPSDVLRSSMEESRGGGSRDGGDVGK